MARASGAVAEWLGRGLQSLAHQFDSGRRLSPLANPARCAGHDDLPTSALTDCGCGRDGPSPPRRRVSLDGGAAEGEHVCDEDLRLTNCTPFPDRRRALVPGGECLTLVTSELA